MKLRSGRVTQRERMLAPAQPAHAHAQAVHAIIHVEESANHLAHPCRGQQLGGESPVMRSTR